MLLLELTKPAGFDLSEVLTDLKSSKLLIICYNLM
jgi:hypothetical protein